MTFQESVEYLLSLGNEVSAMKLGLENIRKLLDALSDPQKKYLKVQVAGTNGKGSVCAFLDSICRSAGIKTGLYTSPHLISITERIRMNGADISEAEFARLATLVRETCEKLVRAEMLETVPTYFEQVTAIALIAFAEAGVQLAILETGLGGRLDATTAAEAEIVAITPIDYDHQEYLGESLAEIAAEKAAIIRAGTTAIVSAQPKDAERVILERCREVGVEPIRAATNIQIRPDRQVSPVLVGTITTQNDDYASLSPSKMLGRHQFENAAVAIALAEALRTFGLEVKKDAIISGVEKAEHTGRLQFDRRFLFDGAHNPAGVRILVGFLDEFVHQPLTIVFGTVKPNGLDEIASALFPKAVNLVLTRPNNSRALDPEEIVRVMPNVLDKQHVFITKSVGEALDKAVQITPPNGIILVTGSLYLVGDALAIVRTET